MNSFQIGANFEQYALDNIFTPKYFDILELTHDFNGKYFVESNLNPDIKLRCKKTKIEFWIECKFIKSLGVKYQVNTKQLNRYHKLKEPVFYLYGQGDNPEKPIKTSLIHINIFTNETKNNYLTDDLIEDFEFWDDEPFQDFNETLDFTKTLEH